MSAVTTLSFLNPLALKPPFPLTAHLLPGLRGQQRPGSPPVGGVSRGAPSPEPPSRLLVWFSSSPAHVIVPLQNGICSLPFVFPIWQASPCWLENFPLQSASKLELPVRKLPRPEDVHASIFSSPNGPRTSQHRALKIFNPHVGKLF